MTVAARQGCDDQPAARANLETLTQVGGLTLVTGVAGFIGLHVAQRLLDCGGSVVGVDALHTDISQCRLAQLTGRPGFTFRRLDLSEPDALAAAVAGRRITRIVHLAARANPRASVAAPAGYVRDNLAAFAEILEFGRLGQIEHLIFSSSGSVYGGGDGTPSSSTDPTGRPRSFYAATKTANEAMAYSYAACHGLPCTVLRLFSVYGPWARPDSAAMIFARAIRAGRPVPLFGAGAMTRSFTYVGDVTSAIVRAAAAGGPAGPPPFRVANVAGPAATVERFAATIEQLLGTRAGRRFLPVPDGDVPDSLGRSDEDCPTPLAEGLRHFTDWFMAYPDLAAPLTFASAAGSAH
jgi:UDP-glucuronate 4-epimerase